MAVTEHIHAPSGKSLLAKIGKGFMAWMIKFAEARGRTAEIQYYNNLSDEQLAKIGLRREDIARHVFRDICF